MISIPAAVALVALVLVVVAVLGLVQFLRLTAGERGLRPRLARLFRRPVTVRRVPEDHYYHRYWS